MGVDDLIEACLEQQRLAAYPKASAWVSASAGTGKTKVLIDRICVSLPQRNWDNKNWIKVLTEQFEGF